MKIDLRRGGLIFYLLPIVIVNIFLFSSCTPIKNTVYFKSLPVDTTISRVIQEQNKSKIVQGDLLSIMVTSFNNELDMVFNAGEKSTVSLSQGNEPMSNGHLVENDGTIKLHFIGKIKAAGLTLFELQSKIEEALLVYMKDPIVNVKFVNKKVTVVGSVNTPKIVYLNDDYVPLMDVLAQSGDLKDEAIAKDIMIFRDSADTKLVKHINLEDHSIFSSPWYYSKPNDIIYVKKDIDQTDREEKKRSLQLTLSLFVSFATLVVIILNNLIK